MNFLNTLTQYWQLILVCLIFILASQIVSYYHWLLRISSLLHEVVNSFIDKNSLIYRTVHHVGGIFYWVGYLIEIDRWAIGNPGKKKKEIIVVNYLIVIGILAVGWIISRENSFWGFLEILFNIIFGLVLLTAVFIGGSLALFLIGGLFIGVLYEILFPVLKILWEGAIMFLSSFLNLLKNKKK